MSARARTGQGRSSFPATDGTAGDQRARIAAAPVVLRAGGSCLIGAPGAGTRIRAVDDPFDPALAGWIGDGEARLVLTLIRARAIGLAGAAPESSAQDAISDVLASRLPADLAPARLAALADPGHEQDPGLLAGLRALPAEAAERAGILLAKRAGLLPAVLSLPDRLAPGEPDLRLDIGALAKGPEPSVTRLVEARLPIAASERARLVLFRGDAGEREQLALVVGRPDAETAPLVRLHSECLTGDLFGSLRCDCGQQLDGAIRRMAASGAGILLYLRQEGRGIGLANKLRAYRLQDEGLDTVDANTHLGFAPDERDFAAAASMLKQLGIGRIRLLTNNPDKLRALGTHGIEVVERVPLSFAATAHNRGYLTTKAMRSGHLLQALLAEASGGTPGLRAAAEPPWA